MRSSGFGVFITICFLVCNNIGHAESAGSITPEHGKVNTADPSTVDPGHYEIELNYGYLRATRAFNSNSDSVERGSLDERETSLVLTAGLIENWDMYFGLLFVRITDDETDPNRGSGIGDVEFGGRYRFINNETAGLEVAYTAGFVAPTGSDGNEDEIGTSQQYWSLEQAVILSKDWGQWTMNAELGYSLPFGEDSEDSDGGVTLNAAVGYQITPAIQPELELNYGKEFVAIDDDADVLSVTAGLVMPLSDSFLMKAGVVKDVSGTNADKATLYLINLKLAF